MSIVTLFEFVPIFYQCLTSVWGLSGVVLAVSGGFYTGLGMCDTNILAKVWIKWICTAIASSSKSIQCVWMPISGGVCMVSGGVWMVCKSVWGCIKSNLLGKCYIRSLYSDIAFPSNALYLCKKKAMSGGVWMVSVCVWWCVRVSGESPSGDVSIPNPLAKCYIRSLCSDIAFSPSAL